MPFYWDKVTTAEIEFNIPIWDKSVMSMGNIRSIVIH